MSDNPPSMPIVSERLMALMQDAITEALEMLRFSMDFVPFVLLYTREGRVLRRFQAGSNADAIAKATGAIALEDERTEAYVLLYDALIEVDGRDVDAFIIEAGERHHDYGVRFAQRYQQQAHQLPALAQGNIAYLGQIDLYLA